MLKCSFCTKEIERGTGKQFIQKTGKVLSFCSKKCEANLLRHKRSPFKVKWVTKKKTDK